jgi:hypothetical protein
LASATGEFTEFMKVDNRYLLLHLFVAVSQVLVIGPEQLYYFGKLRVCIFPLVLFLILLHQLLVQPLDLFIKPMQAAIEAVWFEAGATSIAWLPCL